MSFAYHSSNTKSNLHNRPTLNSSVSLPKYKPSQKPLNPMASSKVAQLSPRSRSNPIWLRFLFVLHTSSAIFTFFLISASLTMYAVNVYMPKLWNQQYKQLTNLQRDEHQMIAANEILKHKIAQQAETPNSGLVEANPNRAIFLKSIPVADVPKESPPPISIQENIINHNSKIPLAY